MCQDLGIAVDSSSFEKCSVKNDGVHGALAQNKPLKDFTWFYPEQIEALKALYKAIHEGCDVPLQSPANKWAFDSSAAGGSWKGFMNHFHCSKKKIDCGGLDIEKLLEEIK